MYMMLHSANKTYLASISWSASVIEHIEIGRYVIIHSRWNNI